MKELTKAEEQVMQILWEKEHAFVKEILEAFPEPKPAYNTISTIIRILEKKAFVSYEAFGKSHRYYPVISKESYTSFSMKKLLTGYFEGSIGQMVSFFMKDSNLTTNELDDILNIIEDKKEKK